MKKIKNSMILLLGILSSFAIYGIYVYASGNTVFQSTEMNYTSSKTAKQAVDELYSKYLEKSAAAYYAFGMPTTSSSTEYPTTTSVFLRLKNNTYAVCFNYMGNVDCFEPNKIVENKTKAQNLFGSSNCLNDTNTYHCGVNGSYGCNIDTNGNVSCYERTGAYSARTCYVWVSSDLPRCIG